MNGPLDKQIVLFETGTKYFFLNSELRILKNRFHFPLFCLVTDVQVIYTDVLTML